MHVDDRVYCASFSGKYYRWNARLLFGNTYTDFSKVGWAKSSIVQPNFYLTQPNSDLRCLYHQSLEVKTRIICHHWSDEWSSYFTCIYLIYNKREFFERNKKLWLFRGGISSSKLYGIENLIDLAGPTRDNCLIYLCEWISAKLLPFCSILTTSQWPISTSSALISHLVL